MRQSNRDFVRVGRSRIEGKGVFAKWKIPMGTRIIEYQGEKVAPERLFVPVGEDGKARIYAFRLDENTAIDGARGGNEARFINHSCAPNCEAYAFDGRLYIYAMADIPRGEELTFDYKLAPAIRGMRGQRTDDLICHCGAATCRGTMRRPKQRGAARRSGRQEENSLIAADFPPRISMEQRYDER
jgi:uncharacterized protein